MDVRHTIDPVFDSRSRVLILGTMPSPKSRQSGFYYAHPQNRFWRVMAALFEAEPPPDADGKRRFLLEKRIALWDVLAACDIENASDATIRRPAPNDLTVITKHAPIKAVFTTGRKAAQLYRALGQEAATGIPAVCLPSTSTANCRLRFSELIAAYSVILDELP